MHDSPLASKPDVVQAAYQDGRRIGLATGALALSIVAFLNLLAVEKSILAIVLALLAMQGADPMTTAFRRSRIALAVAAVHIVTIITLLILFREKLLDIVQLLQKLA